MKKKNLPYYLSLNYPITIIKDLDEDKVYFEAAIPDLPGCSAHGKTVEDALKNLDEAKRIWLKVSLKKGLSIPEPTSEDEFSGRLLLRIPAKLHMQLALNAKKENLSLNQYIRKNLETAVTLESVLKRVEELSQEIKQLPEKISKAPEASSIEWRGQPLRVAGVVADTAGVGIWADLDNRTYSMHESSERKKKTDTLETFFQQGRSK